MCVTSSCSRYCPEEVAQLMSRCWDNDPDKRPCFQEILTHMENLKRQIEALIDARKAGHARAAADAAAASPKGSHRNYSGLTSV